MSYLLGVDKMSTKVGMKRMQCELVGMQSNTKNVKSRKTVSYRSPSSELKCPMQIIFFVGIDKNIYLSTKSNLNHKHHPRMNSNAILRGQRDLDNNDIDLITLLNDVNVSPSQIVNIMEQLKGHNGGTFLPKRVYDLSQKVEDLQDFANGLLPECNDAQKTIIKLENSNINHFYILHDDTGLYAISKGRPSTETVRMRLVCPLTINDQLESMRKDHIMNDKAQMLVMISMATDEMIQMVAMYPEVWFMDTTAGDIIVYYDSILLICVFKYYVNSFIIHVIISHTTFIYALLQEQIFKRRSCLLWLYVRLLEKLFLAISQLSHHPKNGCFMLFIV